MKKKFAVAIIALALVVVGVIGGTLAWLTAQTGVVTNTFTVGDINIKLWEDGLDGDGSLNPAVTVTGNEYKITPGATLNKRPYVVVEANSEACWLFVKVKPENNTITGLEGNVIQWSVDEANGWKPLDGVENVWYREVDATTADVPFDILAGDSVKVNVNLTKAMLDADGFKAPTLSFVAYAVQKEAAATATAAWEEVNPN